MVVGALEAVTQEANAGLDVEVSRNPPVPHLLHLGEEEHRKPLSSQEGGLPASPLIRHQHKVGHIP